MVTSAYLFDLDGTLYTGDSAIPGAPEALAALRRRGIPFRIATNTTRRSRAMLVERLRRYGFDVRPEEIFTATVAGVEVARAAGYRVVAPFVPPPALEDFTGLTLSRDRPADAIIVGDLAEE